MSVYHVMFMAMKQDAGDVTAMCKKFVELLLGIPGVEDVTIGPNFRSGEITYSHAAVVRLKDKKALEAYGPHPNHTALAKVMTPFVTSVQVVDYEFNA